MREIYYNSNITLEATNEIKLLSLYYDKINIVNDSVYRPRFEKINGQIRFAESEELQFIPKSFEADYKMLIDEKLISITKRDENEEDEYEKRFSGKISNLINSSQDLIFPNHPTEKDGKIISEEIYNIMKYMLDFEWGKPVETNFIWWYYAFKLKWFLKLLLEGENCMSSSNNLNILFSNFLKEITQSNIDSGVIGSRKSLALDALKISLPNPDLLSFEDILELKHRLKDELSLFYQTINSVEIKHKALLNSDLTDKEYQSIFFREIQKPLSELENKMKNLTSRTFRKFVEKMQNPKTYVPLIGTVVASIPIHYALLASLGMTSGTSYMEYKEEKREVSNNGLYFLLKLKN